jgi:hypothetical protein
MLYSNDVESDAVERAVTAKINLSSRYAVRDNDTATFVVDIGCHKMKSSASLACYLATVSASVREYN